jgi:hypothetical protein
MNFTLVLTETSRIEGAGSVSDYCVDQGLGDSPVSRSHFKMLDTCGELRNDYSDG